MSRSILRDGIGENGSFASFHPLVAFLYFGCVIGITVFSMHPLFLAETLLAAVFYAVLLYGVRYLRMVLLICLPLLFITAVLNPLFNHRGVTVLFFLNGNPMTLEAFLYGLAAAVMLISVVVWFGCFSKIMTADKFIYLFGRILPALSLVLSICLRYVPLLKNRFKEISEGQKCMGRDYGFRQPVKKLRQLVRELSILIAWSLETSIETADSMEARGYGLRGRTSFHLFKFTRRDGWALLLIALTAGLVISGCAFGIGSIYYYPAVYFPHSWGAVLPVAAAYLLLLAFPAFIDLKGEYQWAKLNFEA